MRRIFLLVAAVVLVDTAFYAAIVPLLPHYTDELGLSQTAAGVLTASYAAGTLVASLPGGLLAARIGVKPTLLSGLSLLAVTSLIFGHATDTAVLDAARFAQGVGGALSWAGGLAWLIQVAPESRRGELIGGAISAAIGGVLLGPVLGAAAVELGPSNVFSGVAVVGAGLAAWAAFTPGVPVPRMARSVSARELWTRPVLVGIWLVALPAAFAGAINVVTPLRLDELGTSGAAIGAIFLAAAAVEGVITPLVGRVSDRRGRFAPIMIGLVAAIAVGIYLPVVGTAPLVAAGVIVLVAALAFFWAPAMAMLSDVADTVGLDQGMAAGFINLAWAGGQLLGAALGGALADSLGDAVAYGALVGLCGATLAALLLGGIRAPISAPALADLDRPG
jgi:MFS family permease